MSPDSLRMLAKCAAKDLGQSAPNDLGQLETLAKVRARRIRVALCLTQEALARELTARGIPCSRNSVANYENPHGTTVPAYYEAALEVMREERRMREAG